ncbi:MAG: FtsW/RodA/SpoVE family cell cycle protein [bacterium]
MLAKLITSLKNMDWILMLSVFLLVCLGLVELYSVSSGQGGIELLNFKKQLFFVMAGFIIMILLVMTDYYFFYSYNNYFYLFGLIILTAVLFLGTPIHGTKSWFNVFGLGLQPVELVKFILIIFLARYFSAVYVSANVIKHLVATGFGTLIFIILVLLQPDLGSAFILLIIWLIMVALIGLPKRYLLAIATIFLIITVIFWNFFFKDYQKDRIISFISPISSLEEDYHKDYNVNQSMIAIGAGGWLGKGLGFGSQSQLRFLPEASTDFIFAVVAEELGFVGVILTLLFFAIFFYRVLKHLPNINNDFGIFFILGGAGLIFIEMFINIGMNMGLLPVIGIALPFLSYGGSAMISNLIIVGVMQSIIVRSKIKNY